MIIDGRRYDDDGPKDANEALKMPEISFKKLFSEAKTLNE